MSKPLEKRVNWNLLQERYQKSSREKKHQLLNELCDLYEMNRKYLIRKLNTSRFNGKKRRGAKPKYPPTIYLPILKKIWFVGDQLCSKKLKSILPEWLPFYEKHHGKLEEKIRHKCLQMSPATMDRLLKPVRAKQKRHGLSGTKPGTLIKNQIPIKTNQWEETKPGFMEADTVAHCGNSLAGDFVWSLTMTDIATAWTESRATWNKGSGGILLQIESIESSLPFAIKGFDCDNGSEFLNYHLIRYFAERPKEKMVEFTRSRPYKKNDNAHVEQKNWMGPRQLFGYDRFDDERLVKLMNDLYSKQWSQLQNHFIPNMKCIEKTKVNSRYKKKFDTPKTPYERVLASNLIDDTTKEKLKKIHHTLDPFKLKKDIEAKLKRIFQYVKITNQVRYRI